MKTLGSLLVIFLVMLGVLALIPLISVGFGLLISVGVLAIWILPFWIILTSDATSGLEKFCWLLAMICLSWFAWIFYFFLAPLAPRRRYRDHYHRDYDRDYYDYRY